MGLPQEGSGWMLGKGSSPEGGGHGTVSSGQQSRPQAAGVPEAFGQCSQTQGLNFGWSCVEPGVGLDDPCGSIPTWFYYFSGSYVLLIIFPYSNLEDNPPAF
mgnify:FL=1